MFTLEFLSEYDTIIGSGLTLKIREKNNGTAQQLPFYYYDVFANSEHVGKISIRIGHNYHSYFNGNIGYEIDEPFRGSHFSLEACRLVIPVARAHSMRHIYLTCDETNRASSKIIELLGGNLVAITTPPKDYFAWCPEIKPHKIYELFI